MTRKKCFVIMRFAAKFDPVYIQGIKRAVEDAGLDCLRLDQDRKPKDIGAEIVRGIIDSDLIIADLTDASPNVWYELGISHTIGNKTIVISQHLSKLPFDLLTHATLSYDNSREGIELLYFRLKEMIPALLERPHEPSNLVQIAGRDFFDLRGRIRATLERLVEETNRMTAFQAYLENGRRTDNGSVTRALASLIANAHRTTGDTTLVAISGAAGLGKTTLAKELVAALAELSPRSKVGVLPTDAFMLSREERAVRSLSGYDPRASSVDQLSRTVRDAGQRQPVAYRGYDHRTGQHAVEPTTLGPCDVVLVEGIHSFHPLISHLTRIKLFLYAAPADAKEMRFLTDLFERNYNVHLAFQHAQQEYGEFEAHVLHYARLADRVVQVDSYWNYSLVD